MTDVRTALAEYFSNQAGWRERKAEEYPDDRRNADSALRLRQLAEDVLTLPVDDERLRIVAGMAWIEDAGMDWVEDGVFLAGEEAGRIASRAGVDDLYRRYGVPPEEADTLLHRFADACVQDAKEETGSDPVPWEDPGEL